MAGSDNDHAGRGADWLGLWFGPEVTEPVRLHVAAKRYLCGTDPGYHALLSPAARDTLSVQGGPMGAEEARRFAAGPFAGQAVRVRRWDDHAKQPGVGHEGLGHFLPLLRELDRAGQPAGSPPDLFPADGRANANGPDEPGWRGKPAAGISDLTGDPPGPVHEIALSRSGFRLSCARKRCQGRSGATQGRDGAAGRRPIPPAGGR
jgi:hypothetical protein